MGRLSICPSNGKDEGYHIERTMMISILTWTMGIIQQYSMDGSGGVTFLSDDGEDGLTL